MRLRVLCEPRGFTRLFLQSSFLIATVTLLSRYDQIISVNVNCKPSLSDDTTGPVDVFVEVPVVYPFSFNNIKYDSCSAKSSQNAEDDPSSTPNSEPQPQKQLIDNSFQKSYAHSSRFFMAIQIISLLFSLTLVIYYVFFEFHLLKSSLPGRQIDFYGSIALSVLSLIAAIVFSVVASGLTKYATAKHLSSRVPECSNPLEEAGFRATCSHGRSIDKSQIYSVTILGYINFIIWIFTIWFSYKETRPDKDFR